MQVKLAFVSFIPAARSYQTMFIREAMTYKATIRIEPPGVIEPQKVLVEAWSSQYDRDNANGEWHGIRLPYITSQDNVTHTFATSVVITSATDFAFTWRMKIPTWDNWQWSHGFKEDGFVHVEPARDGDKWTQGPNYDIIIGAIHVGNFIAASNAKTCGFTHVLNCAEYLDLVQLENFGVIYKKIPMKDGAANRINEEQIKEAVSWLKEHNKRGNKILICCRAGIGRAGSVAIAFVFAENPRMTYEDAQNYVTQKRFIYPHSGLKEVLYTLYPRKT